MNLTSAKIETAKGTLHAIKWESAIALHKPAYWVNIKSLPKSYIKGVIKNLAFKNITQKC